MSTTTSPAPFDTDVAIIGCGPVGATLANLLGLRGVSTTILEREGAPYHLPRAVHFDGEVMRVFETIGLAGEIEPTIRTSPGMLFVDSDGRLLLDWSRPAEIGPDGWYPSYRFHQPDLEAILRRGLARYDCVTFRERADVFAVDEDEAGVALRFEDLSSGRLEACRARFVVGCDGARSLVRRLIGSGQHDLGFHERWLVVDAVLKRPRPDLGDYSVQYCDPARAATYVRGTGDRRRWEIAVLPHEDGAQATEPAHVWSLLAKWITPEDAVLERAALYTFHSVIADTWRSGRLQIAGDSAHQTPPFLGQGMCAGIRDAANLAWKLERVSRGHADRGLLDTYESERSPHVRAYIELAVQLGGLINAKAVEAALAGRKTVEDAPARMVSIKPSLGSGLSAGSTALTGTVAPQWRLADGQRLDARVGYCFALVMRPALAAAISVAFAERLRAADVALVADDAPQIIAWLDASGSDAVLVRPDRYIVGTASGAAEVADFLALLNPPDKRRNDGGGGRRA